MKIAMKDKEFREGYELLAPEYEIINTFIKARKKARYSQLELAEKLNLQQPAIARLERGGYTTTTVGKLAKVADALGYRIKISLCPKKTTASKATSKSKSKRGLKS
jgi:transcriptional regulator with XRE-family HTH domain